MSEDQPTGPESPAASAVGSERPDPSKLSKAEKEELLRKGLGSQVASRLSDDAKQQFFDNEDRFSILYRDAQDGMAGTVFDTSPAKANKLLEVLGVPDRIPDPESPEMPAGPPRRTPGVPENPTRLDDILQQAQAEAQMSPAELMGFLKAKLDESRDVVASLGAKRGTRLFNRSKKFNMAHAHHMGIIRKLTGLRLNNDEQYKDLTAAQKVAQGHMLIAEEYGKIKALGEEKMNGTVVGKIVNWMNKGGRFKRFMKYAMVGGVGMAAGLGVGVVTGGIGLAGTAAGAAVGLGAGAGIRGVRGFFAGEGKYGRNLDMDASQAGMNPEDFMNAEGREEEIIDRSTQSMGELFNGAVKERRRKFRRSLGRGALYATLGVGAGYALSATGAYGSAKEMIGESRVGHSEWGQRLGLGPVDGTDGEAGMNPEDAEEKSPGDDAGMNPDDIPGAEFARFEYNAHENPFYGPGKESVHSMGPALGVNDALDNGTPGFNDLTQERWVNSPEQLASVYHAMGLHDVPDNMLEVDKLAETFRVHPSDMSDAYDKVMAVVNADTTHFRIEPVSGAYESEWMTDPNFENTGMMNPASNPQIYWDNYVPPHGGTIIVMDYVNPTTGAHETMMFRTDCGGQRIEPLPEPVYTAPAKVSYVAPQQTYAPVYEEPVYYDAPPPPAAPPPPPPPPPPPVVPPVEPPPPADKPPTPPVNSMIQEFWQPSPVDSGPLNTPESRPPIRIELPDSGGNSGRLAPGADTPRSIDIGPAQSGSSQSGGNSGMV